jgi:murein DD-endopeptidase MepM/ murein hydrolase activator NlpD
MRSHTGTDRYAIDFLTDVGEPVVAARGGVVFGLASGFSKGGPDPALLNQANFVKILHDDGTLGIYAHLQKDSVQVKKGERVHAGQQIARSGFTGYADDRHLHFAVGRPRLVINPHLREPVFVYDTLPIKFATAAGDVEAHEGDAIFGTDAIVRRVPLSWTCRDPRFNKRVP